MPNVKVIDAAAWAALPEISVIEGEDLAGKGIASDTYRCIRSDVASAVVSQLAGTGVESDTEVGAASVSAAASGISLVSRTTGTVPASASSHSITIPGTAQENDFVILYMANDSAWSSNPPVQSAGWANTQDSWASTAPAGGFQTKVMGATPDTSVLVDGAGRISPYMLEIWRGVDTTTPLDGVAVGTATGANPPSITTNTNDALSIIAHFLDDDDAAGTGAAPSGYTDFAQADSGQSSDSLGSTISVASATVATAGAVDPDAFTGLSTDSEWVAHFALRAS